MIRLPVMIMSAELSGSAEPDCRGRHTVSSPKFRSDTHGPFFAAVPEWGEGEWVFANARRPQGKQFAYKTFQLEP